MCFEESNLPIAHLLGLCSLGDGKLLFSSIYWHRHWNLLFVFGSGAHLCQFTGVQCSDLKVREPAVAFVHV